MNTRAECIPCSLRRILLTAERGTSDEWLHRKILAEEMKQLARVDDSATPAEVIHAASKRVARTLGIPDPYREEKRRWIEETTSNAQWIASVVGESPDPFVAALALSAAANILDCEFRQDVVKGFSLKSLVEGFREVPFAPDSVEDLREALQKAGRVLFIHAAAGELLFDKLLIERMGKPPGAVISTVREAPVLAHATREDAEAVGLGAVAEIVDPGIDCLGLPLNACSEAYREIYRSADVVVAKGQACFETLEGRESRPEGDAREVFFLLRAKCPVVARHLGVSVGDSVLERG
jgi:uncharacterized protein with ATP-grasp and redox domains